MFRDVRVSLKYEIRMSGFLFFSVYFFDLLL